MWIIDEPWALKAECRSAEDPDAFHPDRYYSKRAVEQAKAMCRRCPVAAECLEAALSRNAEEYGIWGGTTEPERRALRRQRAAS